MEVAGKDHIIKSASVSEKEYKNSQTLKSYSLKYYGIPQRLLQTELSQHPAEFSKIMGHIDKLVQSKLKISYISSLNEAASIALAQTAKAVIDAGYTALIIDSFTFNRLITDFDENIDYIDKLKKADILIWFYLNSLDATDFKEKKFRQIIDAASVFGKPIVCSVAKGFVIPFSSKEIYFTDEYENPKEYFDSIFGK